MLGVIYGCLFIFFARICDMTLDTVRILFIVKGRKALGSFLGFFQVLIWLIVIKKVFSEIDNFWYMISYAGGFAAGNYAGSVLDDLIALGRVAVHVITSRDSENVADSIRDAGFGVSSVDCTGKCGHKSLLIIELDKKHLRKLYRLISEIDQEAFISVFDINRTKNGFFGVRASKRGIVYRK